MLCSQFHARAPAACCMTLVALLYMLLISAWRCSMAA